MKLGFHCFILTDRWCDEALPVLDTAAALGAQCVEIAVGDDVSFDHARTRRHAEELGLELVIGPGGYWPEECDLSADDAASRTRGLAWHLRQLEVGAEVGAVAYAGALYGHPGVVQRRVPPPDEYPRTADGLRALAERGAQLGLAVVLEPMSHFRTHVANTPAQAMQLIALADHPNLSLLVDTYHMVTEIRDYGAAIREARDRLWGIHACENDRGLPGDGLVPWDAVFGSLREIGFDGPVILESYNSSIGDFAWRRGMFHDVCPDGKAFIRQGFYFITAGMAGPGASERTSVGRKKSSVRGVG